MPHFPTEGLANISFEDLAWLVGSWRLQKESETENEVLDEQWMDVQHNMMLGMFRWMKNGILVTELMQISKLGNEIILQLRHFDKNFSPWEEKEHPLKLVLVHVEPTKAVFRRIDKEKGGWFAYEFVEPQKLRFSDFDEEGILHLELIFNRNV